MNTKDLLKSILRMPIPDRSTAPAFINPSDRYVVRDVYKVGMTRMSMDEAHLVKRSTNWDGSSVRPIVEGDISTLEAARDRVRDGNYNEVIVPAHMANADLLVMNMIVRGFDENGRVVSSALERIDMSEIIQDSNIDILANLRRDSLDPEALKLMTEIVATHPLINCPDGRFEVVSATSMSPDVFDKAINDRKAALEASKGSVEFSM